MDNYNLTLRQRKLLHYLQQQKTYTTGEELGRNLHVSATPVFVLVLREAGDIFLYLTVKRI